MAMNGWYMDEKFHVEMQKEGFLDGIFDNIEDIDIFDFSGGFDAEAPPPPPATALTFLRLTAEENQLCDELNIPEDWFNNLLDDTNFNLDLPAVVPENDSGVGSGSRSSSSSTRARTKRPRPPGFPPRVNLSAEDRIVPAKLEFDNLGSSCSFPVKKKKKCSPSVSDDINDDGVAAAAAVRKCMHCGIQKTPQWRAGPMGPKSLCNACGVRYKSGRLFPEYRPAASPTFVPSVHSNSHKKVVEMRIKACQMDDNAMRKAASPALKNCDLVAYIRG